MIKIGFADTEEWLVQFYKKILMDNSDDYRICDNPDFLFCGTFGHEHLQYDCVKVLFTGEDSIPDFNLYD